MTSASQFVWRFARGQTVGRSHVRACRLSPRPRRVHRSQLALANLCGCLRMDTTTQCHLQSSFGDYPSYMSRTAATRRQSQDGRPPEGSQLEYTRPRRVCSHKLNTRRLHKAISPPLANFLSGVSDFNSWPNRTAAVLSC